MQNFFTPARRPAALLLLATVATGAFAQAPTVGADTYTRAEHLLGPYTSPLVDHVVTHTEWLEGGSLAYTVQEADGLHFLQVDPATGASGPAFDRTRMATALAPLLKKAPKAARLPVSAWHPASGHRLEVAVHGDWYTCTLGDAYACVKGRAIRSAASRAKMSAARDEPGVLSPDGTREAFVRNWNLWVRDLRSGDEFPLTTDGVKNFGYATDNAGWKHTDHAILEWSPDSTKIATFQQDQRRTGDMYLVSTKVGHPKLEAWKYPLPGDRHVTMIERVVVDVPTRRVVRLKMPPDQHRSTLCDDVSCGRDGGWDDVKWAPDGKTLAFVSTSRDHKHEWFRIADAATGEVRTVFDETAKGYFESGIEGVSWRYLPQSHEALWYSQRSDWGQLYLYDLGAGTMKHAVTSGEGNVSDVLHVDADSRTVWFTGVGRTPGLDPYYRQLWKAGLDGGRAQLLTPEAADHTIAMSPHGKYFVDSYSTPVEPPVTVLRAADDGHVIATLARADISRLKAAGWVPPQPITVKARDGRTTLYGLLFKPSNFDPSHTYPIIDYVYPGPQTGSVRGRSFRSARGDNQALAELGFIVVAVDGMGTPWRSRSFHETWYGDMGDNTLPDQVAAIKQLGARYPWIDLDRVGVWGHSGGGNTAADAMFRYPDFFKVGWAESGNHDNRNYEDDWGEKYQGLLVENRDGTGNYDNQANQDVAGNLKGRLMLVHGTMDDNVPPYETLLVVDALIKANKDFDMLMVPNVPHHYAKATMYVQRRRWDYFVRYLMGAQPPREFKLSMPRDD